LAFRPPTPISDAGGNGASFDHSIGRVDTVGTAIGAVCTSTAVRMVF